MTKPKVILITGGTGLVGKALSAHLFNCGCELRILTRNPKKNNEYGWDVAQNKIDDSALKNVDVLIHLAGAGIADQRWTSRRKREILESRVQSTQLLIDGFKRINQSPALALCASAIGYYGAGLSKTLHHENEHAANDFIGQVVNQWEMATARFTDLGSRYVALRIGIVLSKDGGALKEMNRPPVLAAVGSGKQLLPFINLVDLVRLFQYAIDNEMMSGYYNAVAHSGISNLLFTKALAKATGKPFLPIPVPGAMLKLALGEMAQLVLTGEAIDNTKVLNAGFRFEYTEVETALAAIFAKKK